MPLIKKNFIHASNLIRQLRWQEDSSKGPVNDEFIDEQEVVQAQPQQQLSPEEKYASEIVQQARTEARKIRDAAQEEIEKAKAEARQEGLSEGRKQGVEQGKQDGYNEIKKNIQESVKIIEDAKLERNKIIKAAEPEVLRLAVKIGREIVKKEINTDQEIVMNILREAIEKISDNEQVVIKVSHQDLQQVRNNKDLIIDLVEAKNLSIVADKHVEDGGCMIETKLGYIDARLQTKLELIEQALLGVYEEDRVKLETVEKEKQMRAELNKDKSAGSESTDEEIGLNDMSEHSEETAEEAKEQTLDEEKNSESDKEGF